jgi:hypothetical protein
MARSNSIRFPEIEGWVRGGANPLPGESSGIVIGYDTTDGEVATIYVYSRGKIADNGFGGVIKEEFEGAKKALQTVVDMGIYSNLKILKSETAAFAPGGKIKALHSVVTFDVKGRSLSMNSEIIVFPYKSHVVKVRLSRPSSLPASGAAYLRMLKEIDNLFLQ